MSGGHITGYNSLPSIADEIERLAIEQPELGPDVLGRYRLAAEHARRAYDAIRAVDYLEGGDYGRESFVQAWDALVGDPANALRAEVQRLQMERDAAIDERNAWRSGDQDSRIEADRLRGEVQRLTEERDSLRNYTDGFPHLWELMRTIPAEGKNYVEFSVHHEGVGDFCIEIIRKDRKSPHELRREAEAERDLAVKERDQLRETIRTLTTPSAGCQA